METDDNIGILFALVVFLIIVAVVSAGIRAVSRVAWGVLGGLGPATHCGAKIAAKQRELAARGVPRCRAYVDAVNRVAETSSGCPKVEEYPASAGGVYARFLSDVGCPRPILE